jgi:hypothetical protein
MTPCFDFQVGAHDVIKGMEAMVRQKTTRRHNTIHGALTFILTLTHTNTLTLTLTKVLNPNPNPNPQPHPYPDLFH